MIVKVTDHGKDIAISKKEVELAVRFFAGALLKTKKDRKLRDKISVKVSFDDSCFPGTDPYKYIALCSHAVEGKKRPTKFLIELNRRLSRTAIIKALAHEMVHVKQYAKGELISRWEGAVWKGTLVDETKLEYYEYPWELEAFGYEVGLMHWYRCYCKDTKNGARKRVKRGKAAKANASGSRSVAATLWLPAVSPV